MRYTADSVEEYLAVVPVEMGEALRVVRGYIRNAIPDAGEHMGYGIPIFDYKGKGLVGLSAAQGHCSLHLMSPPLAKQLAGSLGEGRLSGATLQFDAAAPLSDDLVRRIVALRIAEVESRG